MLSSTIKELKCRQLVSHVCGGAADLDSALCQQQAHVATTTQLSQLELLSTVEHDVFSCVHNLLIPAQIWSLQPASFQKSKTVVGTSASNPCDW